MVDLSIDGDDRWTIPDDRQLALRGRLDTGWSSYKGYSRKNERLLTEEEHMMVADVLCRRDSKQKQEEQRIGMLVQKLETMRKNVLGDGINTCLVCGTKAGLLKDQLHYCINCGQMVCGKCSVDSKPSIEVSKKQFFCILCHEERQLWKSSGAWFYNTIPRYQIPDANTICSSNRHSNSMISKASTIRRPQTSWTETQSIDSGCSDDDFEIETSSAKAFEVTSERQPSWHGQIDMGLSDPGTNKQEVSSGLHFESSHHSVTSDDEDQTLSEGPPSITFSNNDIADTHMSRTSTFDTAKSFDIHGSHGGSTSSLEQKPDKKSLLGIRRVIRKLSRDSNDSHDRISYPMPLKQHNSGATKSMTSSDGTSISSEQDIDAMFKSYEAEQNLPEKKEYHGKIGMVEFTLQYDSKTEELLVIIHNCKGLYGGGEKKLPYSYVKTYLLPEASKSSKKRTATVKKTANPVYNETLVYHGISLPDIQEKGLRLSVMDEKVGNNQIIGETCIPLKNLSTRPVQHFRRILDPKSDNSNCLFLESRTNTTNPGRIELALHYLSKQEKLVVGIIRCAGLKSLDSNGYSDPYVKIYLLPDPHKRSKQKTAIKKKTLNPEFNEEFTYKIAQQELAKRTLHISVWDHDVGRTNDFIGGIALGIQSSAEALKHWFDTLKTADKRVIKWHTLSEDCPPIE